MHLCFGWTKIARSKMAGHLRLEWSQSPSSLTQSCKGQLTPGWCYSFLLVMYMRLDQVLKRQVQSQRDFQLRLDIKLSWLMKKAQRQCECRTRPCQWLMGRWVHPTPLCYNWTTLLDRKSRGSLHSKDNIQGTERRRWNMETLSHYKEGPLCKVFMER